jgi:DNA-binding transcriptional LysR family regulator
MDLQALRIFVTLAEELHFGRTAEALGLATSKVSHDVADLERELGVSLFTRTSRRVELTSHGVQLRAAARAVLDDVDALSALARELATGVSGTLRVAYSPGTSGLLGDLVAGFRLVHPEIDVELRQRLSVDVADAVQRGDAAVGIGTVVIPGLESRVVDESPLDHLLVPAGHRFVDRPSVCLGDLGGETILIVARASNPDLHDALTNLMRMHQVEPVLRRVDVTTPQQLVDMVIAGYGLVLTGASTLAGRPSPAGVHALPFLGPTVTVRTMLLTRVGDSDPITRAFAAGASA